MLEMSFCIVLLDFVVLRAQLSLPSLSIQRLHLCFDKRVTRTQEYEIAFITSNQGHSLPKRSVVALA